MGQKSVHYTPQNTIAFPYLWYTFSCCKLIFCVGEDTSKVRMDCFSHFSQGKNIFWFFFFPSNIDKRTLFVISPSFVCLDFFIGLTYRPYYDRFLKTYTCQYICFIAFLMHFFLCFSIFFSVYSYRVSYSVSLESNHVFYFLCHFIF